MVSFCGAFGHRLFNDLLVYRRDALRVGARRRIHDNDPYFENLREGWSQSLRAAYQSIAAPEWMRDI